MSLSLLSSCGSEKDAETSFIMLSVGLARDLPMAGLPCRLLGLLEGLVFFGGLADSAFHFHLDEPVKLDRILHWQYSGEWFHESGDYHAEGLCFGQPSGHEVEQLILVDPSNGCFVGYCRVVLVDFHVGVG